MKRFWESGARCAAAAIVLGLVCTAVCAGAFAGAAFFLIGNTDNAGTYAMVSLGAGSFCGGWVLGKFTRRRGLPGGAMCGAAIYLVLLGISLVCGGFAGIEKLLLTCVCGAAGGVYGVNSKRPGGLMK
jgi:putative membrane protein (TIGR04086 family)